jgi:CheY-like chemotaxis protein
MNGVELCAAVKKMGGSQPMILTTGSLDEELGGRENAADLVLRKPVTQLALRHALNEVTQLSAAASSTA